MLIESLVVGSMGLIPKWKLMYLCHKRPLWLPYATLTMVFSVTYYLELRKATTLYCKSHIYQQMLNWLLDIIEHLYLIKKGFPNSEKI